MTEQPTRHVLAAVDRCDAADHEAARAVLEIPALFLAADHLTTAPSITEHPDHNHADHTLVGFIVRKTRERGETVPEISHGRVGRDMVAFPGPRSYVHAVEFACHVEATPGAATAVDHVYECGCRS